MNIEILDNGNGSYSLSDQDRATLQAATLLTENYKGGGSMVKYDPSIWDNATVYDPQAEENKIQAEINALQTEETALQVQINPSPTPPQQLPPQ